MHAPSLCSSQNWHLSVDFSIVLLVALLATLLCCGPEYNIVYKKMTICTKPNILKLIFQYADATCTNEMWVKNRIWRLNIRYCFADIAGTVRAVSSLSHRREPFFRVLPAKSLLLHRFVQKTASFPPRVRSKSLG